MVPNRIESGSVATEPTNPDSHPYSMETRKRGGVLAVIAAFLAVLDFLGRANTLDPFFGAQKDTTVGHVIAAFFSVPPVVFVVVFAISGLIWCFEPSFRRPRPVAAHTENRERVRGTQRAAAPAVANAPPRVFVDVSPYTLMGYFRSHTRVQAEALVQPYVGKWLTLHGVVDDVADRGPGKSVMLYLRPDPAQPVDIVGAEFDRATWGAALAALQKGQAVRLVGRLRGATLYRTLLGDCELLPDDHAAFQNSASTPSS